MVISLTLRQVHAYRLAGVDNLLGRDAHYRRPRGGYVVDVPNNRGLIIRAIQALKTHLPLNRGYALSYRLLQLKLWKLIDPKESHDHDRKNDVRRSAIHCLPV